MSSPDSYEAIVRSYYRYVDEEAYDALFELFAEDIVYDRPGHDSIVGMEDFKHFYLEERAIETGEHSLIDILTAGQRVAVMGRFDGMHDGNDISIMFSDFFKFDQSDDIGERNTFTDQGEV